MSTADLDDLDFNDDDLGDDNFDMDNLGDADGAMFDMDEEGLFDDIDMNENDDLDKHKTDSNHNKAIKSDLKRDIQTTNEFKNETEDLHTEAISSSKQELHEINKVSNALKEKKANNDSVDLTVAETSDKSNVNRNKTQSLSGNKRNRDDSRINSILNPSKKLKTGDSNNGNHHSHDFDLNINAKKLRNPSLSSSSQQITKQTSHKEQNKHRLRVSFQDDIKKQPNKLASSNTKKTGKKLNFRLTKMHSKDEETENNHSNTQKADNLKEEPVDIEALIDFAQKKMDSIYHLWQKANHDYTERRKQIEDEFTKQIQDCINRVAEEKQGEIESIHHKIGKNETKRVKLQELNRYTQTLKPLL